jgi:HAD superfamily hydrolase (TIGR01509 family)
MVNTLLIDNDGVLVDTEGLFFRSTREVLLQCGAELTLECFIENCLKGSRGAWFLLEERGFTRDEILRVRERRDKLYLELLTTEEIEIPGARAFLEALNPACRICVVTSSKRIHFDRIHQRTGFGAFFNHVLTIEDYGEAKPSPAPYLTALARMNARADEVIVVEDSERGLTAAAAAGLCCIVVPHALTANQDFGLAWKVVANLQEALAQILPVLVEE